ncbi:uncharacterized protein LOC129596806 [Paramacrobiotus metropolitanus]|uniref:uncharacterized protein LOC129596806 n=1 Tax=Paramacrobiotus metropolitanus TaxID=2943436 RepID=UPI002445EF43|nr:uncharacterized protein LOC129596806 [Paramacrobiotus metropolitanus]
MNGGGKNGNRSWTESAPQRSLNGTLMPSKIFIGGLAPQTNKEHVQHALRQYGPIVDINVITDKSLFARNGEPRRYAFVEFGFAEDVDRVLRVFQRTFLEIHGRRLNVAKAYRRPSTFGKIFRPDDAPVLPKAEQLPPGIGVVTVHPEAYNKGYVPPGIQNAQWAMLPGQQPLQPNGMPLFPNVHGGMFGVPYYNNAFYMTPNGLPYQYSGFGYGMGNQVPLLNGANTATAGPGLTPYPAATPSPNGSSGSSGVSSLGTPTGVFMGSPPRPDMFERTMGMHNGYYYGAPGPIPMDGGQMYGGMPNFFPPMPAFVPQPQFA